MTPGELVGPYRLVKLLGRGGMGEVYSAVHERTEQAVAIKLLGRIDSALAARLIQEARALSRLDHPGVVRVLFQGETAAGEPYLVMEQVAGRPLRALLNEHPQGLPAVRAVSLMAQVAAAMAAVHARKIVHRDLKPENILVVARPGMPEQIKVIDFGIASVPPPERCGFDTLVETGDQGPRWLGTAAYMAPEQCRRGAEMGPAIDVYALGLVLYESLCGRPPFWASDPVGLVALHLQARPALTSLPTGTLRRLVDKMLAKEPAERPSMGEVAMILSRLTAVDGQRRVFTAGLAAAFGAAVLATGLAGRAVLRQLGRLHTKKSSETAIAQLRNGISTGQMPSPGLILLTQLEEVALPEAEMLAALSAEERSLPWVRVSVPAAGTTKGGDFDAAAARLAAWFEQQLAPLLAQRPEERIVYFGLASIPLMVYLGWLIGPYRSVEVRLRHHRAKRFMPWGDGPGEALELISDWSHEASDRQGDVVVKLATSYPINSAAVRAAVSEALCEVDLRLATLGEDVLQTESQVSAVAAAWQKTLDTIGERFPRVRRVHLFASVPAGLAFLLGTVISRTMHPPISLYQYRAGTQQLALTINTSVTHRAARTEEPMEFQPLFTAFHEAIKLKNTDENSELRVRRDEILEQLRQHMKARHALTFTMFNSGSYAMGTGVRPLANADYDIDVGVVFSLEHAQREARLLKKAVYDGLPSSIGRVEWRRPCITVFRKDHHVDLGVYIRDRGGLWLAVGKQTDPAVTWQQDGIELFITDVKDRFPDAPLDREQFRRTIRYLKRWKDIHFQGNGVKAPVGLALTVMAYRWFSPRRSNGAYDDLTALTSLVERIVDEFQSDHTQLLFPRAPGDNLLRKLSAEQVKQMRGRFSTLLTNLCEARRQSSAAPLRRMFGNEFPVG